MPGFGPALIFNFMFTKEQLEKWERLGFTFPTEYKHWAIEEISNEGAVSRYDFLPIVFVNTSRQEKNCIVFIGDCKGSPNTKINLGMDYDDNKRVYTVPVITIAKNSISRIPVIVERGYDPVGFQDGDGVLKFRASKGVKISCFDSSDTDYDSADVYDLTDAAIGDRFVLEVDAKNLNRGDVVDIQIIASDDDDGYFGTSTKRSGICGQFQLKVVDLDSFLNEEFDPAIDLINSIAEKYNKRPTNGEYSINYCIQAADRFLGKLLNDDKNFYTYDDESEKLINSPNLYNAITRAKKIKELGYAKDFREFSGLIFNPVPVYETDQYGNNPSYTLRLKEGGTVKDYFSKLVGKRIGYHVFYLSLVDSFHTLILIVDSTNPCDQRYAIYDEAGLSKNYGKFSDIEQGILAQSQWVYRWTKSKYGYWPKLNCMIMKIQRK